VLEPGQGEVDQSLLDTHPRTLGEAWRRLRAQLSLRSVLCRHALRLSVSLMVGCGVMWLTDDPHGFWILLTIVFVSQPQYAATLTKLTQRVMGTVIGLATFGSEVIAPVEAVSPEAAVDEPVWIADRAEVPPIGTPVTVVIEPVRSPGER